MTLKEALKIKEIKRKATYRGLASLYYPKSHKSHGIQICGEYLCREALKVLYPNADIWSMHNPELVFGKEWVLDNVSAWCSSEVEAWLSSGGELVTFGNFDSFYWWQ